MEVTGQKKKKKKQLRSIINTVHLLKNTNIHDSRKRSVVCTVTAQRIHTQNWGGEIEDLSMIQSSSQVVMIQGFPGEEWSPVTVGWSLAPQNCRNVKSSVRHL